MIMEKLKFVLLKQLSTIDFYRSMIDCNMDDMNLENMGYKVIPNWTRGIYRFSGIYSAIVPVWLRFQIFSSEYNPES
jgi:hypothetical protein